MYIEGLDLVYDAVRYLDEAGLPEYQWLFAFVGILKARYSKLDDISEDLDHLLQGFADDVLETLNPKGNSVDWHDLDSIRLEFEKAWASRQHPLGTEHVQKAIYLSGNNYLELDPALNRWVRKVINAAFLLQESKPGEPIFLPINDRIGDDFRTTPRTLSLALNKAIELDYVHVVEEAVTAGPKRIARRLTFNYYHPEIDVEAARARIQKDKYSPGEPGYGS